MVWVIDWWRQATKHYLDQCWTMLFYVVIYDYQEPLRNQFSSKKSIGKYRLRNICLQLSTTYTIHWNFVHQIWTRIENTVCSGVLDSIIVKQSALGEFMWFIYPSMPVLLHRPRGTRCHLSFIETILKYMGKIDHYLTTITTIKREPCVNCELHIYTDWISKQPHTHIHAYTLP